MDLKLATQQLAKLLAQPEVVTQADIAMLNTMVNAYPFYKPLYLLLAKANIHTQNQAHEFAKAALYNGGNLLHKVIYEPEKLVAKNLNFVALAIKADEIEQGQNLIDTAEEEIFEEIVEVETVNYTTADAAVAEESISDDELVIENIVASDFFAFEKGFDSNEEANEPQKPAAPLVEEYDQEAEAQTVSKYNDDKLPYTFLWWLAKTRKEHEQIFQPYVTTKTPAPHTNNNELQQQYVEHIFHLQTPFNIADEAQKETKNELTHANGNDIIDNFIKNEPQIKPPKPEQINNENKAKKSAEDHNDLVSETLAAIYIEQMLYQKAIDTYEKLSLKFPEKSRYFANLIKSLEKKI